MKREAFRVLRTIYVAAAWSMGATAPVQADVTIKKGDDEFTCPKSGS
jgi:hypothetical protein